MGMPTYQGLQENRLNEQFIMGMLFPHCSRASGTLGNYLVREVGALRGFLQLKFGSQVKPEAPLLPCRLGG